MDEILELQRQLAEVQLGSSSNRLSERNCVELVMKLQSLKLIDLIFTRSGREYLTHRQLSEEIEDEILTRGGRVNIIDLPDALNVDLTHIEAKLPAILEKTNGEAKLVRGEVVTEYYLSSLAEEVNDNLSASETGVDTVGSVATRYNLPVSVVAKALTSRAGKEFTASFEADSGTLRSTASIQRSRGAARGALSGVTCPSTLVDVAERLQIPVNILLETMEDMQKKGEINGKVEGRGARAVFVPEVFSVAASKAANAHFLSSGFITLSQLQKMSISNPEEFCTHADASAMMLSTCIVGSTLVSTLRATIVESNKNASWVDLRAALPPDFPEEDAQSLIAVLAKGTDGGANEELIQSTGKQKGKLSKAAERRKQKKAAASSATPESSTPTVFGNRFIVAPSLLQSFRAVVSKDALEKANERARELESIIENGGALPSTEGNSAERKQDAEQEISRKGKGKNRRRAGGKDKDAASGNGGPAPATDGESSSSSLPISVPSEEEVRDFLANDPELQAVLQADYMGNTGLEAELLDVVVEALYSGDALKDVYHAHAREAVASLEKLQKERQQAFEKNLLSSLDKIELYDGTSGTLEDSKVMDGSKQYICNSLVYPTAVGIINKVAKSSGIAGVDMEKEGEMTNAEKLKCIRDVQRQLPSDVGSLFKPLVASLSVKSSNGFSDFLSAYDGFTQQLNMPKRRPLDKKKERSLSTAIRAELVEQLNNEDALTGQKVIELVAVLLHARSAGGAAVCLPTDIVGEFCELLEANAKPAEARAALRDLRLSLESVLEGEQDRKELSSPLSAESKQKLLVLREFIG